MRKSPTSPWRRSIPSIRKPLKRSNWALSLLAVAVAAAAAVDAAVVDAAVAVDIAVAVDMAAADIAAAADTAVVADMAVVGMAAAPELVAEVVAAAAAALAGAAAPAAAAAVCHGVVAGRAVRLRQLLATDSVRTRVPEAVMTTSRSGKSQIERIFSRCSGRSSLCLGAKARGTRR